MILFKANPLLKDVFLKLIKTMGENVHWSGTFIVNNNELILFGRGRSLFFNFDTKRVHSTIIDIDLNEDAIEQMVKSELLENVLNMTLYAFGKWGQIKGLTVERDYEELSKVLRNIFNEIKAEAVFTEDFLQFFKDGIQITYEDTIQIIIEKNEKTNEEEIGEEYEEEKEESQSEDTLGLWHKIVWKSNSFTFKNEEISESDRNKVRIGKDFYMVKYKCPSCREKLHMVVFPMGKELKIETDEGAVYMARAYTCNSCHHFYTPKPNKLLAEGKVHYLDFEEDHTAYDDYLELLGKTGERTSNGNFNMYESEYKKEVDHEKNTWRDRNDEDQEEEDDWNNEDAQEDENDWEDGEDWEDEDDQEDRNNQGHEDNWKGNKNQKSKNNQKNKKNQKAKHHSRDRQPLIEVSYKEGFEEEKEKILDKGNSQDNLAASKYKLRRKGKETQKYIKGNIRKKTRNAQNSSGSYSEEIKSIVLKEDFESFEEAIEKFSAHELSELKKIVLFDDSLDIKKKNNSVDIIKKHQQKAFENIIHENIDSLNGKSYGRILKAMEEMGNGEFSEMKKIPAFSQLVKLLEKTGKRELENIISKIPQNLSKSQYNRFKEIIGGYERIDKRPYQKYLDERRDSVEKQEIISFIKGENSKDRKSSLKLYQKLKGQKFEERNVAPFLEKIYDEILTMDKAQIDKICPSITEMSFEEGLLAYEKINLGEFLPELKEDSLSAIDKRLTKIKMDECEQLVYKISKQLDRYLEEDSRVHFNDVRKMMKDGFDDTDSIIVHNALNTFGINRGRYEYPILVCDTSSGEEGKRGFILTPNHIFYSGIISSGEIDIMDINRVYSDKGLFGKGIFVMKHGGEKIKISNTLKEQELVSITKILNEFIGYLQEKPESRNISYLAKENHQVKYCYRCGFRYKDESICPRCGSKLNR